MVEKQQPTKVAETTTIASLREDFTIIATCACGNTRELHALFLRRHLGAGVTVGRVRQKLRCHCCQARMPQVQIYRLRG